MSRSKRPPKNAANAPWGRLPACHKSTLLAGTKLVPVPRVDASFREQVCARLIKELPLIRPCRRPRVCHFVFTEQPQVIERNRQHLVAVIIALVHLAGPALVLVERLLLRLL